MPAPKSMEVEILSDGTVRCETGDMSGPAHKVADDFLKELEKLLGGESSKEKLRNTHTHDHEHGDHHHHH
jgi:hypothetical protein